MTTMRANTLWAGFTEDDKFISAHPTREDAVSWVPPNRVEEYARVSPSVRLARRLDQGVESAVTEDMVNAAAWIVARDMGFPGRSDVDAIEWQAMAGQAREMIVAALSAALDQVEGVRGA